MRRPRIQCGAFSVDLEDGELWQGQEQRKLTPKAAAVLRYLAQHPGQIITKDELLRAVWGDTVVSEAALTVCIRELR